MVSKWMTSRFLFQPTSRAPSLDSGVASTTANPPKPSLKAAPEPSGKAWAYGPTGTKLSAGLNHPKPFLYRGDQTSSSKVAVHWRFPPRREAEETLFAHRSRVLDIVQDEVCHCIMPCGWRPSQLRPEKGPEGRAVFAETKGARLAVV